MAAGLPFGPVGQGAASDMRHYSIGDGQNGWAGRLRPASTSRVRARGGLPSVTFAGMELAVWSRSPRGTIPRCHAQQPAAEIKSP